MLSPTMFEVASTVYRLPNFLRMPVRNNTRKAELIKTLRREDKENYGPLLETTKQKRKKSKSLSDNEKMENIPEISESKKSIPNNGEFSWVMTSTRMKNLKIMRINQRETKSNDFQDKLAINKLVEKDKMIQSVEKEIIPMSKVIFRKKPENIAMKRMEENTNGLYDTFNRETSHLESLVDDVSYSSIMGSLKKDEDKWESSEILSLKPKEQNEIYLPGVTRILNETMSEKAKEILDKWKKKMIRQLGEKGFEEYCSKLLDDSKIIHSLVEKELKKEKLPDIPEDLKPCFNSMRLILKDLTDVRMLESHVVHPTLGYRGFVDCVARYRGDLCIIDWKKSEKPKDLSTTYDSPLQVSAYVGALNADRNYPFQVKSGILVIAYTRGQPPSVFQLSEARLEFYWKEWLKRLDAYKTMKICI